MPRGIKPIMEIWSFKRKQYPDGTLNKHKARFCTYRGQHIWGNNYWEKNAPVVNWVSVRFLFIISQLAGLETQALDFVLALPQEKLDVPVYMKIPPRIDIANGSKDEYLISLKSIPGGIFMYTGTSNFACGNASTKYSS